MRKIRRAKLHHYEAPREVVDVCRGGRDSDAQFHDQTTFSFTIEVTQRLARFRLRRLMPISSSPLSLMPRSLAPVFAQPSSRLPMLDSPRL